MIVFIYKINYFLQENIRNKKFRHNGGIWRFFTNKVIDSVRPDPLTELLSVRLVSYQLWNIRNRRDELRQ